MTTNRKNELIAQLVNILSELIEANDPEQVSKVKSDAVEMLTVKECTEAVKGLSEHTVRKLIKQGKLPYLRTGDGVNGKMLINKADLLASFNGKTTNKSVCMLRTAILRCLNVNRQKNHKHHRTKDIDLGILPKRQKDTLSYLTYS